MSEPVRIAMWSGPRTISTAMMRSFGSRGDCAVTDEPFYGAFLKATGDRQPMADEVIASMDCAWDSVAETMRGPVPDGRPIWYQKHMPHQMVGPVDIGDFPDHAHAFLIRDPARVIASYAEKRVAVDLDDLGLARQCDYFERIADRRGTAPPVIDSGDVLANPESVLTSLCAALGIAWDPAMLQWAPGLRPTDGIWASHWYNAVAASSGFAPPPTASPELDAGHAALADRARPYYDRLKAHRLTRSMRT
ncbi:HAD family hydrolase [Novosphingopyxis sp.]|uniref:sulfotransferase-like domain-containing protein n=1 Tax=Novosphingopyxis sp. TaxID=2709690 RepID=UPI003B5A949D